MSSDLRESYGYDEYDGHDGHDDNDDLDRYSERGDEGATRDDPRGGPPRGSARRRRVALVVAIVMVLAVALTWVVAFSSLFGVRSVDVRGNHVLTSAEIDRAAHITNGTPLVRVDAAAAQRRVERLPAIRSVTVSTSFPSTVVISVHERTPVGYVTFHGRAVLVDGSGLQYRTVPSAPAGLPHFALPSGASARATGSAVATVAAAMPPALRAQVDSIQALDASAITVVFTRGRIVRWGSVERSADKVRVLPVLLRSGNKHIDVTDPDQPFTH